MNEFERGRRAGLQTAAEAMRHRWACRCPKCSELREAHWSLGVDPDGVVKGGLVTYVKIGTQYRRER